MEMYRRSLGVGLLLLLSACATPGEELLSQKAEYAIETPSNLLLKSLPEARKRVPVAVYEFRDDTGQHKPSDSFAEYSRAVTQGATSILVQALQDSGENNWFQVVERASLQNLLQERKLIRALREQYKKAGIEELPSLPPLVYAAVILEGSIVAYESNTLTGGFGARYLGIGGSTEYRRDRVSVYIRATSVRTGEVLNSVGSTKTIYSVGVSGGVFKFVGSNDLLEIESGFTRNEPPQLAVRRAIEKALYGLVMEGAIDGHWAFADAEAGRAIVNLYLDERGDGRPKMEPRLASVLVSG